MFSILYRNTLLLRYPFIKKFFRKTKKNISFVRDKFFSILPDVYRVSANVSLDFLHVIQ